MSTLVCYRYPVRCGLNYCRWGKALELLASIETRGLAPDVVSFTSVMSACDRAGEWQVMIFGAGGSSSTLGRVAAAVVSRNLLSFGVCVAHFETFVSCRTPRGRPYFRDSVVCIEATLFISLHAGWQRTLDIMDRMLERDIEPNIVSYGTAISACARGGTHFVFLLLL